jgi:hypothetical protein
LFPEGGARRSCKSCGDEWFRLFITSSTFSICLVSVVETDPVTADRSGICSDDPSYTLE